MQQNVKNSDPISLCSKIGFCQIRCETRQKIYLRLRAVECPKEIIDQIGGWSSSDVGETYGEGFPLDVLDNWFKRIFVPITL